MLPLLTAMAASYLAGSIPTAYLVVKWLKRGDVRTIGSGNVGATNVTRAAGLWAGAGVFAVDLAKGWLAASVIAPALLHDPAQAVRLACGVLAVIGHTFPVFLKFKGGKGVATTIGVLAGGAPQVFWACLAAWAVAFALSRYVSVGSLAAAATLPVMQILFERPLTEVLLGTALAALIILRHRANITRLLQGTEHHWTPKKSTPENQP